MHALACQRVCVSRKTSHQSFTFTCFHFCDTTLMQYDSADYLYRVGLFAQNSPCTLTAHSQCFGQYIVKAGLFHFSSQQSGLLAQFLVRHCRILIFQFKYFVFDRFDLGKLLF